MGNKHGKQNLTNMGKLIWEINMGNKHGKQTWQANMKYGKPTWETNMGNKHGKQTWEINMGNKHGKLMKKHERVQKNIIF